MTSSRSLHLVLCLVLACRAAAFGIQRGTFRTAPIGMSRDGSNRDEAPPVQSRRDFGRDALLAVAAASSLPRPRALADAGDGDDGQIEVYFGCGCFWHVRSSV